jgi:hypothetical protein
MRRVKAPPTCRRTSPHMGELLRSSRGPEQVRQRDAPSAKERLIQRLADLSKLASPRIVSCCSACFPWVALGSPGRAPSQRA